MNNNDLKLSTLLIDLVLAAKEDDLNKTKEIVDNINALDNLTSSFELRNILNPNRFFNDSAIYAAKNLNNIARREELLFTQQVKKLYYIGDTKLIAQFLNNVNIETLEIFQISDVFQMCIDYGMYEELSKLRKRLSALSVKE